MVWEGMESLGNYGTFWGLQLGGVRVCWELLFDVIFNNERILGQFLKRASAGV